MSSKLIRIFKALLPAPFTIAVILSVVTFLLAFFLSPKEEVSALQLLTYWEEGLWNAPLLVFAVQMMLMLVLGHVLALSNTISNYIDKASRLCTNTSTAAAFVTLLTLMVSFFNWGLGLVFGAIFARKVGEYASKNNIPLNYPLIGAAGYSGLMVWHGGISGSAPIKIAEEGHFLESQMGVISQSETIFSSMNITVSLVLLIVLPLVMYILGKKGEHKTVALSSPTIEQNTTTIEGAERLDHSNVLAYAFGGIILFYCFYKAILLPEDLSLSFITPNFINLFLLGLGISLHASFYSFLKAINQAIGGASGILIQFPLYFGIMGLMNSSGLVSVFSDFFVSISNSTTFPIFTFFSAGIVNVFVPSGGGQWGVQGPIIIEAASQLNVPYWKSVMALAYGDQITNMLQPFWALPLLGITGLKAKEILPYSLLLMLAGVVIFIGALLIF
ncbi:MAG: short-chain fatty acid transporter [Flavobacteriales bacterium]|nr:short-chain fatty acid transporter [Flavobacteriales bacterium]MBL6872676.1 short-chain fatty acid transporter [Flavobacteriales bacterium]